MKYIRQHDGYSCGPIAIYNALVALGEDPRNYRWIYKDCNPDPKYGTLFVNMNRALYNHIPITIKCNYIHKPTFEQIRSHVRDGGIVIVCEHWETDATSDEHYYTIVGMNGNNFLAANFEAEHKNHQVGEHRGHLSELTPGNLRTSLMSFEYEHHPAEQHAETVAEDLSYPGAWFLVSQHINPNTSPFGCQIF